MREWAFILFNQIYIYIYIYIYISIPPQKQDVAQVIVGSYARIETHAWPSKKKNAGRLGITHIGTPQAPSSELSPVKRLLLWRKSLGPRQPAL